VVLASEKPVIAMTHSQFGPSRWILGNPKQSHIKALIAMEPSGPLFQNAYLSPAGLAESFLETYRNPLAYDPPISTSGQLKRIIVEANTDSKFHLLLTGHAPAKIRKLIEAPSIGYYLGI